MIFKRQPKAQMRWTYLLEKSVISELLSVMKDTCRVATAYRHVASWLIIYFTFKRMKTRL